MNKRIIINESERQSILRLHEERRKLLMNEQAAPNQDRWKTGKNQAQQVQMKINDKCDVTKLNTALTPFASNTKAVKKDGNNFKLIEDGVFGQASRAAFMACGGTQMGSQQTTTATTATTATTVTQGTEQGTGGTPVAGAQGGGAAQGTGGAQVAGAQGGSKEAPQSQDLEGSDV